MKRIALLLSGNLRTFMYKDFYIAKTYLNLVNKQDIDIYIYTDNNDFNIDNIQYFSENNTDKILGIQSCLERRYHDKQEFINYEKSEKIIKENLFNIFKNKLKKIYIENYDSNKIEKIYDKQNINHNIFMNNNYSNYHRKTALMCQFYKLYKCYELMNKYEEEYNFKYDIIIKSRFDGVLNNINDYDIRSLDLTNKIYCEGYNVFMNDWWAIGNRQIMSIYCNYYFVISSNMTDGIYCVDFGCGWEIVNNNNFRKDNIINDDASDSGEFGLTYLIKHKNSYILFYNHEISINLSFKFYS